MMFRFVAGSSAAAAAVLMAVAPAHADANSYLAYLASHGTRVMAFDEATKESSTPPNTNFARTRCTDPNALPVFVVRWSIREHGGEPSSRLVDELLDERNSLTER